MGTITELAPYLRVVFAKLGERACPTCRGVGMVSMPNLDLYYPGSAYLFDEPTTGLHPQDVDRLIHVFDRLVQKGSSVIVVEHNPSVLLAADWIIDLGPEVGNRERQNCWRWNTSGYYEKSCLSHWENACKHGNPLEMTLTYLTSHYKKTSHLTFHQMTRLVLFIDFVFNCLSRNDSLIS